jgi:hypothetical protein
MDLSTKENIITRMKIDRGISYGVVRKIFEEKIQASKKTYAEIAGKFIDDLAKYGANELQAIKKKRLDTKNTTRGRRRENQIKSQHRKTDEDQGRKCEIKATYRKYGK